MFNEVAALGDLILPGYGDRVTPRTDIVGTPSEGEDTTRYSLSSGAAIMVHRGSQIYDDETGEYFTLAQDARAYIRNDMTWIYGGEYTPPDGGAPFPLQVTTGGVPVEWIDEAALSSPTWPDAVIRAPGTANTLSPATAFHQVGIAVEPKPKEQKAGMSTGTKVAIGVGVAAGLVLVVWWLKKK